MIKHDRMWGGHLLASSPKLRQCPLEKLLQRGVCDECVPSRGFISQQMRGVQRQSLPALAVFQFLVAHGHQYAKAAYTGVEHPELPRWYSGMAYSLAFTAALCGSVQLSGGTSL